MYQLAMFKEDKGSWMIMAFTTLVWVYIGSFLYNAILEAVDPDGFTTSEITDYLGITNEVFFYMAASGTWFGDIITAFMV